MRWVLLMLVTVNACYLLWMVLTPTPGALPSGQAANEREQDRGVSYPGHLPQVPTPGATSPAAADAQMIADQGLSCLQIGAFPDQDSRVQASQRWSAYQPQPLERWPGDALLYRVHVSAGDVSGPDFLAEVRQALTDAGVTADSFLITEGDFAGYVSFGLFRQQDNALALQQELAGAGIDAELAREHDGQPALWLELRYERSGGSPVQAPELSELHADLQLTENLCETIAPAGHFP